MYSTAHTIRQTKIQKSLVKHKLSSAIASGKKKSELEWTCTEAKTERKLIGQPILIIFIKILSAHESVKF